MQSIKKSFCPFSDLPSYDIQHYLLHNLSHIFNMNQVWLIMYWALQWMT